MVIGFVALMLLGQTPDVQESRQLHRKEASVQWENCAREQGTKLSEGSREPADTVADAAMARCAKFERDFEMWTSEIVKVLDDASAFAARVTAGRRREVRGLVIGDILDLRAGRKR